MFGREIRCFRHGEHCLDCMAQGAEDLSPLVILQSLEYPGWPTQEFCSQAELAGFRTISVRRPGFGRVPPVPDVDQQVALIGAFLEALGRPDIVLVSSGTANPLSYRLARHPQVGLTVLGNCCFNHDPMGEIRPDWFARNMEQTLTSLTGARLALMGLKGAHGIFGKFWVTENFMQKSPGDLDYLQRNRDLFAEAVDSLLEGMDIHTFITELRSTLKEDPFLQDGCFDGVPVLSVSGIENSETWKIGIRAEADRLGVPLHFFQSGDALVVYQSAGELLDLLGCYA